MGTELRPPRARGSRNGRAVLDELLVAEARELRREGLQVKELAILFECSTSTIKRAVAGQTYPDPPPPPPDDEDDQAAAEMPTAIESPPPRASASTWGSWGGRRKAR